MSYTIAALYKFVPLPDCAKLRTPLQNMCDLLDITGTLLLAPEGINGTVAGSETAIANLLGFLRSDQRLTDLDAKVSMSADRPFLRMKVRLKREIVTMGVEGIDPTRKVGTYVEPKDWNALISDPDTILIDTRNDYEVEIGTFRGALDPETETFRNFPAWVEANREALDKPKVAMFCTGGIRCEKASAFMLENGFENVFHLKGGILKYLEQQSEDESLWDGDCFVFDQRVAVTHGLAESDYEQCFACRRPLRPEDKAHPHFQTGVSCHRCHDEMTEAQKAGFAERQRQIELARNRGDVHVGRKA